MRHLILHIGHGKTGTSFIQTVLSINACELKKLNIHYPNHTSFSSAKKGYITSGNMEVLSKDARINFGEFDNLMFSSENLFFNLLIRDNFEKKILSNCDKLSVILYTRNVMEMLISAWGQAVKRAGETQSLNEFLVASADMHHSKVLKWIELSKEFNFDLYIKNYSLHKRDIFSSFYSTLCEITKIKASSFGQFTMPENDQVNRSMTLAEYTLLQCANKIDKRFGSMLSDALVNNIPNLLSEEPTINKNIRDELSDKYEPLIEEINRHIDPSEAIIFENTSAETLDIPKELTKEQIDIFSETFANFFVSKTNFSEIFAKFFGKYTDLGSHTNIQEDVNKIRDISLKIESEDGKLDMQDALILMKIAHNLRPDGPVIKAKVEKWQALLKKSSENE
ncbi:MAG: hypothetical protein O3C05_02410 [Proteobacteria bacterium]|nr:hypothetical protein [Pseudomonadota bacterium]